MYKRCKAGIGYLPQEASVFRKMTVYDNIMAALEFTYDNNKVRKERADVLMLQKVMDMLYQVVREGV